MVTYLCALFNRLKSCLRTAAGRTAKTLYKVNKYWHLLDRFWLRRALSRRLRVFYKLNRIERCSLSVSLNKLLELRHTWLLSVLSRGLSKTLKSLLLVNLLKLNIFLNQHFVASWCSLRYLYWSVALKLRKWVVSLVYHCWGSTDSLVYDLIRSLCIFHRVTWSPVLIGLRTSPYRVVLFVRVLSLLCVS